jgi:hypothetical protein
MKRGLTHARVNLSGTTIREHERSLFAKFSVHRAALASAQTCRKLARAAHKQDACITAGVAELADALDSKSSGRKAVWVRAPPPAVLALDVGGSTVERSMLHTLTQVVCRQEKSRDASTSPGCSELNGAKAAPPRDLKGAVVSARCLRLGKNASRPLDRHPQLCFRDISPA